MIDVYDDHRQGLSNNRLQ